MPIYEFECEACGSRFEQLTPAGTQSARCRECGAERTRRVLSAQARPMKLIKSRADTGKQERSNERLRKRTKADFKDRRRRARERSRGGDDG